MVPNVSLYRTLNIYFISVKNCFIHYMFYLLSVSSIILFYLVSVFFIHFVLSAICFYPLSVLSILFCSLSASSIICFLYIISWSTISLQMFHYALWAIFYCVSNVRRKYIHSTNVIFSLNLQFLTGKLLCKLYCGNT